MLKHSLRPIDSECQVLEGALGCALHRSSEHLQNLQVFISKCVGGSAPVEKGKSFGGGVWFTALKVPPHF